MSSIVEDSKLFKILTALLRSLVCEKSEELKIKRMVNPQFRFLFSGTPENDTELLKYLIAWYYGNDKDKKYKFRYENIRNVEFNIENVKDYLCDIITEKSGEAPYDTTEDVLLSLSRSLIESHRPTIMEVKNSNVEDIENPNVEDDNKNRINDEYCIYKRPDMKDSFILSMWVADAIHYIKKLGYDVKTQINVENFVEIMNEEYPYLNDMIESMKKNAADDADKKFVC